MTQIDDRYKLFAVLKIAADIIGLINECNQPAVWNDLQNFIARYTKVLVTQLKQ